jgi:hypothetical protein
VIVHGNVAGSQIQAGSHLNAQMKSEFDASELKLVREFISELKTALENSDLDQERRNQAEVDLATARLQLESPKPNRRIVLEVLTSLRSTAESFAGSAAWAGVFALIHHLPKG